MSAGTSSVKKVGRPSDYTSEEDTIILSETNTRECQRKLVEAGFEARTPAAIHSRRRWLREQGGATEANTNSLATEQEARLLFARRRKLEQRREMLLSDVAELDAEIAVLTDRLRDLV